MKKQIILFPVLVGMLLAGCQSAENLVDTTERVVTSIPRKQLKKINSFKEIKSNPDNISIRTSSDPLYHVNLLGDSAIMQSLRLVTLQEIPGFSMLTKEEKSVIDGDYEKEAAMATRHVLSVDVDEAANRIFVCLNSYDENLKFIHYFVFTKDGSYVGELGDGYDYVDNVMPHFSVDRLNRQLVLTSENNVLIYDYNAKLLSMNALPYAMTAVQRLGDYWLCCPSGSPSWQYYFFDTDSTSKKLTYKDRQEKLRVLEEKLGPSCVNADYFVPAIIPSTSGFDNSIEDMRRYRSLVDEKNCQDEISCAILADADFNPVRKIMHAYPMNVTPKRDIAIRKNGTTTEITSGSYPVTLGCFPISPTTYTARNGSRESQILDQSTWEGMYHPYVGDMSKYDIVKSSASESGYCIGSSPNGDTYYLDHDQIWQIHPDRATLVMDLDSKSKYFKRKYLSSLTSFKMSDSYVIFNTAYHSYFFNYNETRYKFILSRSSLKPYNVTATSSTNDLNNVLFRAAQSRARNYEEMSPLDITKSGEWVYAAYPRAIKELAMDHADSWSEADRKTLHDIDVKGSITLVFVTPKPESQWQAK